MHFFLNNLNFPSVKILLAALPFHPHSPKAAQGGLEEK